MWHVAQDESHSWHVPLASTYMLVREQFSLQVPVLPVPPGRNTSPAMHVRHWLMLAPLQVLHDAWHDRHTVFSMPWLPPPQVPAWNVPGDVHAVQGWHTRSEVAVSWVMTYCPAVQLVAGLQLVWPGRFWNSELRLQLRHTRLVVAVGATTWKVPAAQALADSGWQLLCPGSGWNVSGGHAVHARFAVSDGAADSNVPFQDIGEKKKEKKRKKKKENKKKKERKGEGIESDDEENT